MNALPCSSTGIPGWPPRPERGCGSFQRSPRNPPPAWLSLAIWPGSLTPSSEHSSGICSIPPKSPSRPRSAGTLRLPAQIRKGGRRQLLRLRQPRAPRMAQRLIDDILAALDEQTVTVPSTDATALIIPCPAGSLSTVQDQFAGSPQAACFARSPRGGYADASWQGVFRSPWCR